MSPHQMTAMLALTLEIPDWLLNGHFWGGFIVGMAVVIAALLYAFSNFNPFGR